MQSLWQTVETQRNQEKIYERKRSIKLNDDQNVLFSHRLEIKQIFNFSLATLIEVTRCRKSRRWLKYAIIIKTKYFKVRPGFYQISPSLAAIILNENNINIESG